MIILCGKLPNTDPTRHTNHRKDVGVESTKTLTHFFDIMAGIDELFPQLKVELPMEIIEND